MTVESKRFYISHLQFCYSTEESPNFDLHQTKWQSILNHRKMERIRASEIAKIEILGISGKRKRVEDKLGVDLLTSK